MDTRVKPAYDELAYYPPVTHSRIGAREVGSARCSRRFLIQPYHWT